MTIDKPLISPLMEKQKPFSYHRGVIVISGPTATGKTRLSIALAKKIGGEIVSADSMQVYKGMDIGTSKVTIQEMEGVPHHLIDICDLTHPFNVADFVTAATLACRDIQKRGHVPIVVGGTGFYIHSLIYGPPQGPPSSSEVREQIESDLLKLGSQALYEKLKTMDADYAMTITEGDRQKIVRALEIISLTDKKVSDFPKFRADVAPKEFDFRCFFLYHPKPILYPRIEERCERMLAMGFHKEVEALLEKGLRSNLSASQSIGYRQYIEYLDSQKSPDDWDQFLHSFKKASRRYAKRQFTWFRKEPLFTWIDLSLQTDQETLNQLSI